MAEFHFLRPEWLLVLPVAIWLAWRSGLGRGGRDGWRAIVDRLLQPFVLSGGEGLTQRRWPLLTALAAAAVASLALAGPTWDRLPVPAYRSDEALVVALDLSQSMDATDIQPSRLARARLKLLDLLERREGGQTALVVFSANAFTVTPLTTDNRTISALVNALDSSIMPSRGSLVAIGLDKAASLLRQSGASRGEILLVTDAVASPADFDRAAELGADGIRVHVLAVGTEEGSPIPNRDGGFLTDSRGDVVIPQLNVDNLRRLAATGGGRFARLAADDSDLERLFPDEAAAGAATGFDTDEGDNREIDIWRDRGSWLVLALLPLVALGFRRGWVYCVLAGVILPLPRAEAFSWRDLWLNPDQQGAAALARDDPSEAADLFADPEWAAAARYRAGQFDASAAALAGIDSADANYNRANALARAGKLAEAIDAYDRALALEPAHADAEYNRELVAQLLEQQQQQQQQQDQQQDQQGENGEQDDSGQQQAEQSQDQQQGQSESAESGAEQDSQTEEQNDSSGASDQQMASEQQPEPGDEQGEPDGQDDQDSSDDGDQGEQPLQAAATPEEVEDWADEQAADQWLRRIAQDPGGLLRRKFLYQYQQQGVDQDGNLIYPGNTTDPW